MTIAKIATIALVLSASTLAGCVKPAAPAVDKAKISVAIKNDVADLVEALNAKDTDKAVAHDAPGVVGMFHGAPNYVGAEADAKFTKETMADPLAWITLGNETIDVSNAGDMAIFRTTYIFRLTDPKTKKEGKEAGNWLIGYAKQADGSWKITWNVVSDTGTAVAAPADKAKPAT